MAKKKTGFLIIAVIWAATITISAQEYRQNAQTQKPDLVASINWRVVGAGTLASRPATCVADKEIYICNGSGCTSGQNIHYCTATNTWTAQAGGVFTLSQLPVGSANQILGTNSGATAQEHKTLSVGTAGTDFAIAHAANSIALNLPDAGSSARGAITTGTQTIAGAKTFSSTPTFSTMTSSSILFAGTSGILAQDNANLCWDDANNFLGIGTCTPLVRLHIATAGSNGGANVLRLEKTGTSARQWDININSGKWILGDNTAAADRLTVDTAGFVGIGTISPTAPLQVTKNTGTGWGQTTLLVSNNNDDVGLHVQNTAIGGRDWALLSSGGASVLGQGIFAVADVAASTTRLSINASGNVGIGTPNANSLLRVEGDIAGAKFKDIADFNYYIAPANSGTAGTFNGNVGIGTTTPGSSFLDSGGNQVTSFLLDVQPGTAKPGGIVVGSSGRAGAGTTFRQGYFLRRHDNWNSYPSGMWKGSDTTGNEYWEHLIINNSGGEPTIRFMQNLSPVMTIVSSNVKINAGSLTLKNFTAFADQDTTPSVLGGNFFSVTNTVATTITALDDGVNGQQVTLVFTNANTTMSDAGTLKLQGAGNFVSTADDTMTLVFDGTNWYETARSVN